jgi:hypothetical protein
MLMIDHGVRGVYHAIAAKPETIADVPVLGGSRRIGWVEAAHGVESTCGECEVTGGQEPRYAAIVAEVLVEIAEERLARGGEKIVLQQVHGTSTGDHIWSVSETDRELLQPVRGGGTVIVREGEEAPSSHIGAMVASPCGAGARLSLEPDLKALAIRREDGLDRRHAAVVYNHDLEARGRIPEF